MRTHSQLRTVETTSLFSPKCESRAIAQLVTELSTDPVPHDDPVPLRSKCDSVRELRERTVCPSVSRSQIQCGTSVEPHVATARTPCGTKPTRSTRLQLEGYKSHVLFQCKSIQPTQKSLILAGHHHIVLTTFTKRKSKTNS